MNDVYLSFGENLEVGHHYNLHQLTHIFYHSLTLINQKVAQGLVLPNYPFDDDFTMDNWQHIDKSLDIYICDSTEGKALNLDARGKDYATNILSYPSELPSGVLMMMGKLPLGELVICHEVLEREASEQGKSFDDHLAHLVVHGILHLLGFDHELGQKEQDEMEGFEIEILAKLEIANPYD